MKLSLLLVALLLISPIAAISQVGTKDKSTAQPINVKPVDNEVIKEDRSVIGDSDILDVAMPVEEAPSDPVFTVVEKMPEFKGGTEALKTFIHDHLVYPRDAVEQEIQGNVYVKMIVRANGQLTNFEVLRTLSPSLSKAALDVLKLTQGDWMPGEQNGKKVDVYYTVPVRFSLKN